MIAWVLAKIRVWFGIKSPNKKQAIESIKALRSFISVMEMYTRKLPKEQQVIKSEIFVSIFLADAHVQALEEYFKGENWNIEKRCNNSRWAKDYDL